MKFLHIAVEEEEKNRVEKVLKENNIDYVECIICDDYAKEDLENILDVEISDAVADHIREEWLNSSYPQDPVEFSSDVIEEVKKSDLWNVEEEE